MTHYEAVTAMDAPEHRPSALVLHSRTGMPRKIPPLLAAHPTVLQTQHLPASIATKGTPCVAADALGRPRRGPKGCSAARIPAALVWGGARVLSSAGLRSFGALLGQRNFSIN